MIHAIWYSIQFVYNIKFCIIPNYMIKMIYTFAVILKEDHDAQFFKSHLFACTSLHVNTLFLGAATINTLDIICLSQVGHIGHSITQQSCRFKKILFPGKNARALRAREKARDVMRVSVSLQISRRKRDRTACNFA